MKGLGLILSFVFLSGCAGVNISLIPPVKPLEEKVLEGEGEPKILLLDLDGPISFREESDALGLRTRPSKVAFFREALRKAEADEEIAGVILRINSPGGTVAASDTIYHEIRNFKKKRKIPVYAYILELCASGGYYVACASDRIIASPNAVTGSIGVLAMKVNVEGLLSKIGVSEETYKSGPHKDFWSPFRPSTEEEKRMFQEVIDQLYGRFVEVVSTNREKVLSEREVRALADGRIWTARGALEAKLIDQVSYLDEAIESMKKALSIERARVVTYLRPRTFRSGIYSDYSEGPAANSPVINFIALSAESWSFPPTVRFLYLWNP